MADYNHRETEQKWQRFWEENQTYKTDNQSEKPKYYVLDMFPYPSGAGLHVGHPLGYIASDIVARYKRLTGFNVLHPMGFDSFGLPAEQYAIQTGQHPAVTTEQNLARYTEQLKNIGFSFDWSREVRTSDPAYYKWTQWVFMELFRSWYNHDTDKAEPIETLLAKFSADGTASVRAVCDEDVPGRGTASFTADEWRAKSEEAQYAITLAYRLTYIANAVVNWCPGLGTVLANDEVKDGPGGRVSERGGYPVEQKLMRQWMMRITAYADRLLTGLDTIDWSESIKEQQRNWIGRSVGASVRFGVKDADTVIEVFTTRVDTLYGVTFMVLAPEHELVDALTTPQQREAVVGYVAAVKLRSERDRMMDAKTVSGVFTGSYCVNPVSGTEVPIWLADYVLAGYGTGAVMAVPSGDQRDYQFARQYELPIVPVLDAQKGLDEQADNTKEGHYINSDLINGLTYPEATAKLIAVLEESGAGRGKVNFRLRDAVFSRQRYWGEPVPVYFRQNSKGEPIPYLIDEADLPLELPVISTYLPTETGEPPLGRAEGWRYKGESDYELSTMPGWAGSSWYWYRYMDPQNPTEFASKAAIDYWQDVDLYIGGTEHATGHLLYSRFWNKFLHDRGYVPQDEPFKKLINQGMIQGRSSVFRRIPFTNGMTASDEGELSFIIGQLCLSHDLLQSMASSRHGGEILLNAVGEQFGEKIKLRVAFHLELNPLSDVNGGIRVSEPIRVPIQAVNNDILDVEKLKVLRPDLTEPEKAYFLRGKGGNFICDFIIEKMSKRYSNVENPDDVVEKYGADVLRLYEMFLGPLEQAKPWNTNGIDGTYRFIRKLWRLFYKDVPAERGTGNDELIWIVTDETPTAEELKILHKTIKKAQEDIENFSFNTSVSAFMVCVNELAALKCHKRAILQDLVLLLSPYAPHITEELWAALGNVPGTVSRATYPVFNPQYLVEDTFEYPIQINGKVRTTIRYALDRPAAEIEQDVLGNEVVQKWLDGKTPKKIVVVPRRIVNVVL